MIRTTALALALVVLVPHPVAPSTVASASFPFEEALAPIETPVLPTTWSDPQLAAPHSTDAIETWYDCRPPRRDAVCVDGFDEAEIVAAVLRSNPTSPAGWRPIVELYFQPRHVARALRVMRCESGGDAWAKNPTSTASGLFQHLGSLWGPRAERAGWGDADVFDPHANIAVAAWLVYEGGGWGHWNPSRHCWG